MHFARFDFGFDSKLILFPITFKGCVISYVTYRTVREVPNVSQDNIIQENTLQQLLTGILSALHENEARTDTVELNTRDTALEVMKDKLGYKIQRKPSLLSGGGEGLFVTQGVVPRDSLVALYPGTVYWPYEPIFFQSIANHFVFRCVDGLLIDGNDRGISKTIFR